MNASQTRFSIADGACHIIAYHSILCVFMLQHAVASLFDHLCLEGGGMQELFAIYGKLFITYPGDYL